MGRPFSLGPKPATQPFMDSREERAVRNEVKFRKINESIEQLTPAAAETFLIVCECARDDCMRVLEISHGAYEAVREAPTRFAVANGHEITDVERVVSTHGDYLVVEKIGEAALIATRLDPRGETRRQEWEI